MRGRRGTAGEGVTPGVHGGDHVGEVGPEGAHAHVEFLGELFGGEFLAGVEDLLRGPFVVLEEDVEGVAVAGMRLTYGEPLNCDERLPRCFGSEDDRGRKVRDKVLGGPEKKWG